MSTALAIAGLVVCIITLAVLWAKAARRGGKDRERADNLSKSAEIHARADAELAKPLPDDVPGAWDEYCDDGVSDSDRS